MCRTLPEDYTFGGKGGASRLADASTVGALQDQQLGVSGALQHSLYGRSGAAGAPDIYVNDAGLGNSLHEGFRNTAPVDPDRVSAAGLGL